MKPVFTVFNDEKVRKEQVSLGIRVPCCAPADWADCMSRITPRARLLWVHSAHFHASVVAHLFSCTHTDVITSILVALDTFVSLFLISFAESYFKDPNTCGVSLLEEASAGFLMHIAVPVLPVLPLPRLRVLSSWDGFWESAASAFLLQSRLWELLPRSQLVHYVVPGSFIA